MNNAEQAPILVVDDNRQNLIAIESILKVLAQPIMYATTAQEALRYVLKYDFAVILLDVQMPTINGFETARLIRSREKSSYTPIIFLSGWHKDEIDINKGYSMGAVDYIFKPIDPKILQYKVKVFADLFTKSIVAVNLQNELKKRLRAEQQTHRQKHQLELAHLERINVMEEMSSAVAHELNQPLATILNYVTGCIHRLKEETYEVQDIIAALQLAGKQAERAGAILHRIKDFVRKSKLYLEPVYINELIAHLPSLLPEEMQNSTVQLKIKLCKEKLPQMLLDKIQLEQVLLNLLRNAIEALSSCKRLKPQLTIETLIKRSNILIIKVKDNGPGIEPEILEKLFDLYFTTKPDGMGVGLSICRTIIEAHRGHITAYNNPRNGACFQITLPIVT